MTGQFFGHENIKNLVKTGSTSLSLPSNTSARVMGRGVVTDKDLNCDLNTTGLGGLDTGSVSANSLYNIFLVVTSSSIGLVASLSNSPSGFVLYRFIGQIRTNGSSNIQHLITDSLIEDGKFTYSEADGNFTITGTNWTTRFSELIPYKSGDKWRLRFNVLGDIAPSVQYQSATISGVTFADTNSAGQGIATGWGSGGTTGSAGDCVISTGTIEMTSTATFSSAAMSGDVELVSKPTWVL